MNTTTISDLFVYPIKSLAGVRVHSLSFGSFGVRDDRQYMLVDQKHRFITQRTHPVLAQFKPQAIEPGVWRVLGPHGAQVDIYAESTTESVIETSVWKTPLKTREKSKTVSRWFSEQLDELVYLVEFDDLESRFQSAQGHEAPFAFADGYPLLVCNQASLEALNTALGQRLDMSRFRPNIIVKLDEFQEYETRELQLTKGGSIIFGEPCVRCNVPAIDPQTSVYQRELHQQMKDVLRRNERVIFGMNAITTHCAKIEIGDELTVVG